MERRLQRSQLHGAIDQAPQAYGERRLANAPVRQVGDDDGVGAEEVSILRQVIGQMDGPDFLLSFDEDLDSDWEIPAVGTYGAEMHRDPGFVVRCAPSVESPVTRDRLEWWRLPQIFRPRRLHVVVGVEHDRWRPRGWRYFPEHRRMGPVDLKQLHVVESLVLH